MVNCLKRLTLLLIISVASLKVIAEDGLEIPMGIDFSKSKGNAKSKVLLLYVAATNCPYCKRLEKDIIFPMMKNKNYVSLLELKKINLDSSNRLIGFDGSSLTSSELALTYKVKVTPTLLFLAPDGKELTSRLTGYQNDQFYWYKLDQLIEKANFVLNAKKYNETLL